MTDKSEREVTVVRARIAQNHDELEDALARMPPSDPLRSEGVPLLRSARKTIRRLDEISRAARGRDQHGARNPDETQGQVFAAAEERAPLGYCDSTGATDDANCGLSATERTAYRAKITRFVHLTHTNWSIAITAKHLEEKFRTSAISFEQKLGQMLLDLLFTGFGAAAKLAANKGLDKAAKAMTRETDLGIYPGATEVSGPDPSSVSLVKQGVEAGIKKGSAAATKAASGRKTAQQVHEDARVAAPADREAFVQTMKSAPTAWSTSILDNLDQLYDTDLAALIVGLPSAPPTPQVFEAHIDSLLERFQKQVLAVNHAVRPVLIVLAGGRTRSALVTPDMQPNNDLKGEWHGALAPTGKTRFIRWVDDDMAEMANAHHVAENPFALPEVQRVNDAEFWTKDSLELLRKTTPQIPSASPLAVRGG